MNASPINECNRIPGDGVTYAVARMVFPAVLNANARNYTNTRHWTQWARHFGLPSRLNPPIRDAIRRYVLTAFAYGCGLGPTQAARHLNGTVSADQLAFVDRRHVDIADRRMNR